MGVVGWFTSFSCSMDRDVAALKKMGVPTTLTELDNLAPQSGSNAAEAYLHVASVLASDETAKGLTQDLAKATSPKATAADRKAGRFATKMLGPLIDTILSGSKMQRCVFAQHKNPDGGRSMVRDVEGVRTASRLLYLRATFNAEDGKIKEAFDDLDAAERIAKQLSENPQGLAILSSGMMEMTVVSHAHKMLSSHLNDSNCVQRTLNLANTFPHMPDLKLRFQSSFEMELEALQDIRTGREPAPNFVSENKFVYKVATSNVVVRYVGAKVVKGWRRAFESMPQDPTEWKSFKSAIVSGNEILARDSVVQSLWGDMTWRALICDNWADQLAQRRLLLAGAQIAQWKLDHGSWPKTLPISGVNSLDPFTGKPLKFKLKGNAFVVYSVGRDLKDDGGTPRTKSSGTCDNVLDFSQP